MAVLLNDGAGRFGAATLWPTQGGQLILEAADFNGDSRPDLVVGDNSDTSLLLNTSG